MKAMLLALALSLPAFAQLQIEGHTYYSISQQEQEAVKQRHPDDMDLSMLPGHLTMKFTATREIVIPAGERELERSTRNLSVSINRSYPWADELRIPAGTEMVMRWYRCSGSNHRTGSPMPCLYTLDGQPVPGLATIWKQGRILYGREARRQNPGLLDFSVARHTAFREFESHLNRLGLEYEIMRYEPPAGQ